MTSESPQQAATSTEFQVLLTLAPEEIPSHDDLEHIADLSLDALVGTGRNLALGVVVGADYANNAVEVEFTVEATSASEVHEKIGTIMAVLEQEAGLVALHESNAHKLEPEPVCV